MNTKTILEIPIGTKFKVNSILVQCVEAPSYYCDGCFFEENKLRCADYNSGLMFGCLTAFRSDGKDTIFKEVNE